MERDDTFPNPEREWERPAECLSVDRSEVERRLGPTTESLEVLVGGRANVNVRVGPDRVLRIYRRDRATVGKEKALLQHPWESFVVPAVLGSGQDFLVLEYVPHGALGVSAEHGVQVGRALAEIHRRRFRGAGFLGADLNVCAPFQDVIESFGSHADSELDRAALPLEIALRPRVEAFVSAHRDALGRAAGPAVLLHGDFKASNLHWTAGNRLLVLDWEFAYAGPALMDIGQLLRWNPPLAFVSSFAESYRRHGGELPEGWQRSAEIFDLFNLAGLLAGAAPDSQRSIDVLRRIERILGGRAALQHD